MEQWLVEKIKQICDALLVPFVQLKKTEKHRVTFSKVAGFLLKVTLLHGCFSLYKWRNASHIC